MDIHELVSSGGYVTVPNPKYDKKKKKSLEPKTITKLDVGIREMNPLVEGMQATVNDRYSVPESIVDRYADYGIPYNKVHNLDKELADAQSNWSKFGSMLGQTLISEVGAGIARGFSDIFGGAYDLVTGNVFKNDYNYSNSVSEAINEFQENFNNKTAPIYTDPSVDVYNGGLTDFGWYMKNIPSVASTLTLLLPARGISSMLSKAVSATTKGAKWVGREIKAARAIQKAEDTSLAARAKELSGIATEERKLNWFRKQLYNPTYAERWKTAANITTDAALMRVMENYQESHQAYGEVFTNTFDRLSNMNEQEHAKFIEDNKKWFEENNIDPTDDVEIAKAIANKAADRVFAVDASNVVFDVIQLYGLRNIGKIGRVKKTGKIKQAHRASMETLDKSSEEATKAIEGVSKTRRAWNTFKDYGTGAAKMFLYESNEGVEEAINYIAQREGMHLADTILDKEGTLSKYSFWNDRLRDYLDSPELMESAMWGIIGGMVFGVGGNGMNLLRAYRRNKKIQEEYKKKGINLYDTKNNPLNSFISLWDDTDSKAALETITRRTDRFTMLQKQMDILYNQKKNPLSPKSNGEYADIESDVQRDVVSDKLISNYLAEMAVDAKNGGTFDMLLEYFRNDNVKNAFKSLATDETDDIDAFSDRAIKRLKEVSELYDNEITHVNAQAAAVNSRHALEDRIPLTYIQQIAVKNIKAKLHIDNLDKEESKLRSYISKLLNEAKIINKADIQEYDNLSYLSYLMEVYSRLEADKKYLESGKERDAHGKPVTTWRISQNVNAINKSQERLLEEIRGVYSSKEANDATKNMGRVLGSMIATISRADRYEKDEKTGEYFLRKDATIANPKNLEKINEIINGSELEKETLNQISTKIQSELKELNGKDGLKGQNERLWNAYTQLADVRINRMLEERKISRSQQEILERADELHNIYNELRIEHIDKARRTIQQIYRKYKDDKVKSDAIKNSIAAAFIRKTDEAVKLATDNLTDRTPENKTEASVFIDALNIINFSYGANELAYDYILGSLEIVDEELAREEERNKANNAPQSLQSAQPTNNTQRTQQAVRGAASAQNGGLSAANNQQQGQNQGGTQNLSKNPPTLVATVTDIDKDGNVTFNITGGTPQGDGDLQLTKSTKDYSQLLPPGEAAYDVNVETFADDTNTRSVNDLYASNLFIVKDLNNNPVGKGDIGKPNTQIVVSVKPVVSTSGKVIQHGQATLQAATAPAQPSTQGGTQAAPQGGTQGQARTQQPSPTGGVTVQPQADDSQGGVSPEVPDAVRKQLEANQRAAQEVNAVQSVLYDYVDLDATSIDEDDLRAKTIAGVKQAYKDAISEERINEIFDQELDDLHQLVEENKNGGGMQIAANNATFAARKEDSTSANFKNLFRKAIEAFVDEYIANSITPIVSGKKVVYIKDLLAICYDNGTAGKGELGGKIYEELKKYFSSREGQEKYLVVDLNEINEDNALDAVDKTKNKMVEDAARVRDYRVDISWLFDEGIDEIIDPYESIEFDTGSKTNKENAWTKLSKLEKGSKLKLVPSQYGFIVNTEDNTFIGIIPYPRLSKRNNFYKYNNGWRTEIEVLPNGKIRSEFKDVLTNIFTCTDAKHPSINDFMAIRSMLLQVKAQGGLATLKSDTQKYKAMIKAFSNVPYLAKLYATSKRKYKPRKPLEDHGNLMRVTKDAEADWSNLFEGLYRLFNYSVAPFRGNLEDTKDEIIDNIDGWFKMLESNYSMIFNVSNFWDNNNPTTATVAQISDGECIKVVDDNIVLNYDKLPHSDKAFADTSKARIAVVNRKDPNEVIVSDPSGIDARHTSRHAAKHSDKSKGSAFVYLYGQKEDPDLVGLQGSRLDNAEDLAYNNGQVGDIVTALQGHLYNELVNIFTNPTMMTDYSNSKQGRDEQDEIANRLIYILRSIFRTNEPYLDKTNGVIGLLSMRQAGGIFVEQYVNDRMSAVKLVFNTKDQGKLEFWFVYRMHNKPTQAFKFVHRVNSSIEQSLVNTNGKGSLIFRPRDPKAGQTLSQSIADFIGRSVIPAIFDNTTFGIRRSMQIAVDENGISLDNGEFNPIGGFIHQETSQNGVKTVLEIPGRKKSVRLEGNSYSDLLLSNGLMRVNTQVSSDGSNYQKDSEDYKKNMRLSVTFDGVTSPVEGSTAPAQQTSDVINDSDIILGDSDAAIYTAIKDKLINSDTAVSGEDIIKLMYGTEGDNVLMKIQLAAQEAGIDFNNGFNILPQNIQFVEGLNILEQDADGNGYHWVGNLAEANSASGPANAHRFNKRGQRVGFYVPKGAVIVGSRLLNLASQPKSFSKNNVIRTLVHENLHLLLGDKSKFNKDDVIKTVRPLVKEFWTAVLKVKDDDSQPADYRAAAKHCYEVLKVYDLNSDRFVEEFITEGICSVNFFDFMNKTTVADTNENDKESLLSKFIKFINKLFNWKINDNSMYKKFLNTLQTVPQATTTVQGGTQSSTQGCTQQGTKGQSRGIKSLEEINNQATISKEDVDDFDTYHPIAIPENATAKMVESIEALNNYKSWQNDHILFIPETHEYFYVYYDEDGEQQRIKIDSSVTQYYNYRHGEDDDISDDYKFASQLGNEVDELTRAFFLGIDVRKMVFPNLKGSRKEKVIQSLEKLKKHFDEKFNGVYKVVTNEIRYVVNLTDTTDGDVTSVAGTMDMLIIDKDGNKYIYDMKTKNYHPANNKTKFEKHDKPKYGEQTNIYRLMHEAIFPNTSGEINEHKLIWFDQTYPPYADRWSYTTDGETNIITVTKPDGTQVLMSDLSDNEWKSPKLNDDIDSSLISLDKDDKNLTASRYSDDTFETGYEDNQTNVEETNDENVDEMADTSMWGLDDSSNIFDDDTMDPFDDTYGSRMEESGEYYTNIGSIEEAKEGVPLEARNDFIDLVDNGEMNFKC